MKKILFLCCVVLIATTVFACNDKYKSGQKVVITGRLRLVGNEPFSRLMITTKDKKNFLLPYRQKSVYKDQAGQQVKVTGILKIKTIRSADLKHSFREMHLVKVLSFDKVIPKKKK